MKKAISFYGGSNGLVERLNAILSRIPGSELQIENVPASAAVTEAEQIRMMRDGQICMTCFGSMFPAVLAPEYDGSGIPFLFPSIEAVEGYWDSFCGQRAKELIRQRGNAMILGMNRRSPRHLTANRPIVEPSMLQGFRLRIPEIDAWSQVWGGMGATCIQMPQQYVLDSLREGRLDGQENSLKVIRDFQLYKAQKYVMLTQHVFGHIFWVMNAGFYESLPVADAAALKFGLNTLTAELNAKLEAETWSIRSFLTEAGCEFVSVDVSRFARSAKAGVRKLAELLQPEVGAYISRYID